MSGTDHDRRRAEVGLNLLLEGLFQLYEADFRQHERSTLAGRVDRFAAQHELASVPALLERVMHDGTLAHALCRTLLAAERTLFDSAQELCALREAIAPVLSSYPVPRVWAAEYTAAEDVFAFAILLTEAGLHERSAIYATCPDEEILRDMRRGAFPAHKLPAYEDNLRQSGAARPLADYVSLRGDEAVFSDALRSRIIWSQYNLGTDHSFNEFQLISCRSGFVRFERGVRRRILGLFLDSLAHCCVLHLGGALHPEEHAYLRSRNLLDRDGLLRRGV